MSDSRAPEQLPAEPPAAPAPAAATAPAEARPAHPLASALLLRLEAAAVIGTALLSLAFYAKLPRTLPSQEDWRAAAGDIAAQAAPGDAVLLDPHWAERARLFVTCVPVLNLARNPTRDDLAGFRRLFVLSLPDLPRSDRERTFEFLRSIRFRRAEEPRAHGRISVTRFENEQVDLRTFDFTGQVAAARVYIRRGNGSEELCPLQGRRHPCPRASWINVGEEIKEIAFKPQRCLWAHPAGSEPLVVEYDNVTLGRELRVMGGIVGQIVFRHESYGPVLFEVKIDGTKVAELTFEPGEPGERRRSIDTSSLAGTAHQVQFEVSAPNPDMRHFCFDAGAY